MSADGNGSGHASLRAAFAGKHLLVTGVTGFLGKVWLAMVLDRLPEVRRVTVLIRGKKGESTDRRFQRIFESSPAFRPLREKHGQALRALVADKIRVVDARLVERRCGLGVAEARALMADVDCVIHFAGLTDFEPDPLLAIDANVHAAGHVADLAALTPGRRYVHVSTCFVAGEVSQEVPERIEIGLSPNGTRFDPHQELAELEAELAELAGKGERIDAAMGRARRLGWPNIYTYTKGLSEHLVDARDDVRSTTVRPAIVECAREYPFTGWNEGINTSGPIVWLLQTSFQRFPARSTNRFDVVPVDTVARAMCLVTAEALRDRAHTIYHVGSGHLNPLTFERAVDLNGLAARRRMADSDSAFERLVLRHLDPVCVDADRPQVLGYARLRQAARATRSFLRGIDVRGSLPPRLYDRVGPRLEEELRSVSMKCRTTDRKLATVEEMLRAYRPFIFENDPVFRTDHLRDLSQTLSDEDHALFAFDIETLDWRHYWLEVQVPGLEAWCIPLLRGEKVPEDPPLPPLREDDDTDAPSRDLPVSERSARERSYLA